MRYAVIFGGNGFIGQHFCNYLLQNCLIDKVFLVDIVPLNKRVNIDGFLKSGAVEIIFSDVRGSIDIGIEGEVELVCNFAAVHREPGHDLYEYYETNLLGAQNVCDWADKKGCKKIIFTSSIAPYGPTESVKSEEAVPTPHTAYGGSKLAAEKIHEIWYADNKSEKKLVITRPGVVFGAGEGGNVSRLIKAVINRYFFFTGNKNTRKAGTYVKELCNAMHWVMNNSDEPVTVFNMSMNPGPTVEEYVDAICKTANIKRFVPNVPFVLLYIISVLIDPIARLLKIKQPISPVRLKKLVKSNNILPQKLTGLGYQYKYTFIEAMIDWRKDAPHEWS